MGAYMNTGSKVTYKHICGEVKRQKHRFNGGEAGIQRPEGGVCVWVTY